ncbi:MAG: hypothetical protein KTR31_22530 [Myxococcales bacterium]|nr:hypothetical protein [Myxococcales bacterium]
MPADPEVDRLDLERLALGRLPAERAAEIRSLAATDASLRTRLQRVEREIGEASTAMPPLQLPTEALQARRRWPAMVVAVGLAVAALLAWVVLQPSPESSGIRGAGSFDLEAVRLRHGSPTVVGSLVEGRPGDQIQYRITPHTSGVLTVIDVQDDGAIASVGTAVEVVAGEPLTGALQLDDYDGLERVFFVLHDREVGVDDVRRALDRAHQRPLADIDRLPGLPSSRSLLIVEPDP